MRSALHVFLLSGFLRLFLFLFALNNASFLISPSSDEQPCPSFNSEYPILVPLFSCDLQYHAHFTSYHLALFVCLDIRRATFTASLSGPASISKERDQSIQCLSICPRCFSDSPRLLPFWPLVLALLLSRSLTSLHPCLSPV